MLCSTQPLWLWSTAASLFSFIKLYKKYSLYKKREQTKVIHSIYNRNREPNSQRTNISPEEMNIQMYNAWQPSLVLGGLGRA